MKGCPRCYGKGSIALGPARVRPDSGGTALWNEPCPTCTFPARKQPVLNSIQPFIISSRIRLIGWHDKPSRGVAP